MNPDNIIEKTKQFVREHLKNAEHGHDYFHVMRVYRTAMTLAEQEHADRFTVALGALLHDIADAKFHDGDEEKGPAIARNFLTENGVPEPIVNHVVNIIRYVSFKNTLGGSPQAFHSTELAVVQDADRLDAMGAIGIARAFHYGGFKNRLIYDPDIKPVRHTGKDSYLKSDSPTINHFYEKLLLLKDMMNTAAGKALAGKRHRFMMDFLEQFYREWEGKI